MRTDLILRALLPLAALVALVADAPRGVTGGLALAGLLVAAERLARLRGLGLADRLLVATGGVLVALVLTGLVLGSTPLGLRPTTWVLAVVVLSVLALNLAAILPARVSSAPPTDTRAVRRTTLLALPWVAVAVAVAAFSVHTSATSLADSDAPPVQMSLGKISGTEVQVVVTSAEAVGPLEVRTSDQGTDISYPLFRVRADGTSTTTLQLPLEGRFVISLNYPEQTKSLRTLVLDR